MTTAIGPQWLHDKVLRGETVLLDGAMGTELQTRGVPMNEHAWSGTALLSHPEIVREIHEDYLRAGAEVIITNTFSTGRRALEQAGVGADMKKINRDAVALATAARDTLADGPVAIAGSMCPWIDINTTEQYKDALDKKTIRAEFQEQADILAEAGVDLIALEMCSHPVTTPLIVEAASATGLPVWLGLSCRRDAASGALVGFDHPFPDFEELLDILCTDNIGVVNIMHSLVPDTMAGIESLANVWSGPFGAYPESGNFVPPNWQFVDIISPEDLVAEARSWMNTGAQFIGGCCGLGVEHIRALRQIV